ncbi:MAG: phage protease [Chitinophagaceae bacterium]
MSDVHATYLIDVSALEFSEANKDACWVHALPIGVYKHPVNGDIKIDSSRAKRFAEGVVKKIRGVDPSINYVHDNNNGAAGWVKNAEARDNGLWLFVEWVKDAAQQIRDKKWRYFSSEFVDSWEDPKGQKFQDVILGGALTNRPFMKNLVPVNLSEATVDNAFELVSSVTGTPLDALKGGNDSMELTEAQVNDIVAKLAEKMKPAAPAKPDPAQLDLSEVTELKELAEQNPLVAALLSQVQATGTSIVETQKKLVETQIQAKLAEFDNSKLVLTPVAKKQVYDLLVAMPTELHEPFWGLLTNLKKSQSFLVELGERAGASVKLNGGETATKRFTEMVNKLMANDKLSYADAVTQAASNDRSLYNEYRTESFIQPVK